MSASPLGTVPVAQRLRTPRAGVGNVAGVDSEEDCAGCRSAHLLVVTCCVVTGRWRNSRGRVEHTGPLGKLLENCLHAAISAAATKT